MSTSMELSQENLESIGEYVRRNLRSWTDESVLSAYAQRDIELRERMLRVEEELKNQGEIIRTGFARADERFEDLNKRLSEDREFALAQLDRIDERFQTVREDANGRFAEQRELFDTRFADQREFLNVRFTEQREVSDTRFSEQQEFLNVRFAEQREAFDTRFAEQREESNHRFSEQRELFLARFDQIDKRFETARDDANTRYEEQRQEMNSRFDKNSRHNNRWMAVLTIVLGLFGAVATISTLMP